VASARICNQAGLEVSYQTSPLSLGLEIDRVEEDDVLILFDQLGTTLWEQDHLDFARRLVEKLKQVAAVSRESQWFFNTFLAPYILIPEMNVAGKSK